MKEIYLAGGCFWGLQKYFDLVKGVEETEVGYANGSGENPTYRDVCTGRTGFAETVRVNYDGSVLPLQGILELFFKAIDPTVKDRQGNDRGTQYRTGIYFVDSEDEDEIKSYIEEEQKKYSAPIVTEVLPLKNFYSAEEYHQKYLDKNPHGYCHLSREAFNTAESYQYSDIKDRMTDMQYRIMVKGATEPPFSSEYLTHDRDGIYVDAVTGEPLFSTFDQFDSKSGWPSFTKPINENAVEEISEDVRGRIIKEVRSSQGNFHLGHVFNDGPSDKGGLRYCINGAALKFIPLEDLEKEGYDYLLQYVKK